MNWSNYGKPVPAIVSNVPPPVPPRIGVTETNLGEIFSLYANDLVIS